MKRSALRRPEAAPPTQMPLRLATGRGIDQRGLDREDHVDLGPEVLHHLKLDRGSRALGVRKLGKLEI
jgi:hypothetical protein